MKAEGGFFYTLNLLIILSIPIDYTLKVFLFFKRVFIVVFKELYSGRGVYLKFFLIFFVTRLKRILNNLRNDKQMTHLLSF